MARPSKYPTELRERAVRAGSHPQKWCDASATGRVGPPRRVGSRRCGLTVEGKLDVFSLRRQRA